MPDTTPTKKRRKATSGSAIAETYTHTEATALVRPDIGLQTQFKKKKEPAKYAYDPTLDPSLQWAGKAERTSFDVPTLPLFVHERLSTKAILETLKGHKRDKQFELFFADPQLSISDKLLKAYEHRDRWTNRLILGDSLVVMNSLLRYESLGGQVQMIYMDPPYGIQFGSNFQPFVRKREVNNNDDLDLSREPETVQAYRDTWELKLHSYLSYLRDRLLLAKDMLHPSGSIFVQISDENLHYVRTVMDEVFGRECFIVTIPIKKKGSQKSGLMDPVNDYLVWYGRSARESGLVKFRPLYEPRDLDAETVAEFRTVELPDGREFPVSELPDPEGVVRDYRLNPKQIFKDYPGARLFRPWPITNGGFRVNQMDPIEFNGQTFLPPKGRCWSFRSKKEGDEITPMERLREEKRLCASGKSLDGKRYLDDFAYKQLSNWWDGLGGASNPIYVVQTNPEIVQRCLLMTTDPGDLVLDPTCGSGTTAYVAEQWGRRWITTDVSRVPLALARQRLLTSTYPFYELNEDGRGPAGGFVYKRKQNARGAETGGIVPHVTLGTIANRETAEEAILVDRPEAISGVTRVTGPFTVEASIPTPASPRDEEQAPGDTSGDFTERMLEILRQVATLRMPDGESVVFANIRRPAKSLSLDAEAMVGQSPVAFIFGPEDGAVSEGLVFAAAREASAKQYTRLYVIGFAIAPNARKLVETCDESIGIPATYVQATPDILMGDLLKNMRSSQVFSVCGMPEIKIHGEKDKKGVVRYRVELVGLDTFNPVTMEADHLQGDDAPCWLLDTDYNELCFHVSQAFFPRTSAWDSLKKGLKGVYDDSVWEHLSGTTSEPFEAGDEKKIAVKVVDDRGNELLIVEPLPRVK